MYFRRLSIFTFFLLFLLPSVHALNMTSESGVGVVLTHCNYTLTQGVWYDICASPCTNANVYYNITNETLPDFSKVYPLDQKLEHIGGSTSPTYRKTGIIAPWWNDTYYASVKIERTDYDTIYSNVTFTVEPDYPSPTPNGKFDYMNRVFLEYFNILIQAFYLPGSCEPGRPLSVICYVNDKESVYTISMSPGDERINTIDTPPYDFGIVPGGKDNYISCKFYDSEHPWLFHWHNETFIPIAFDVSISPPTKITVGQPSTLQIAITNKGLLTDSYTVNVTSLNPNVLQVSHGNVEVKDVKHGDVGSAYVSIVPLLSGSSQIEINVTSEISGITWRRVFTIETGTINLPEFGSIGLLQIILLSTMVLFVVTYFSSKRK